MVYNNKMVGSRRVCFTVNNWTEEVLEAILEYKWRYVVCGKELAPTTGTPHLQCYGEFFKPSTYKKLAKKWKATFVEAKGTGEQASEYCKKEGDYVEKGELGSVAMVNGGKIEQERWARNIKMAEEGKLEELKMVDPNAYTRCYGTYQRMCQDAMPEPADLDVLENYWVWGPTGVGKSRAVRDHFKVIYNKPRNKWWDGYKGQETVVLEEVCPKDADWLASMLKVWTDHYAFIAEMKGKSKSIRPVRFIVTSNYSLENVFQVEEDQLPLKRRFKTVHVIGYNKDKKLFE